MSDGRQILEQGIGTPLVWLFNTANEVILDGEGRPLSSHITTFNYTYDEEEDDLCDIQLEFQNTKQLNLKYLRQDVILIVQWGYILPGGKVLPSPKRKIAIRDIKTRYDKDKISLDIKGTDLVAYIKSFKTTTTRQFEDPNVETNIELIKGMGGHFVDFVEEYIKGEFQATITQGKNSVNIAKSGYVTSAEYDPVANKYTVARENTAIPKTFIHEFYTTKVTNGKGQTIGNAIKDKLRALDAIGGAGGPYVADTTDDAIHMRQRNFEQRPYKNYTYGGGHGELITFNSDTNTRKVKEKITSTTAVNPEEKLIDVTEVVTIDGGDSICVWPNEDYSREPIPINTKAIDELIENYNKVFMHNINEPLDQIYFPDLGVVTEKNEAPNVLQPAVLDNEEGENTNPPLDTRRIYNLGGESDTHFSMVTLPAKDILMLPYTQEVIGSMAEKRVETYVNSQNLLGYMVEKIQRKYEGTAEVIGDPSLIKAKIYGFYGLSDLDNGLWYAVKVTHKITYKGGYICTLDVIKKPATITIDRKAASIKVREIDGKIKTENTFIGEKNTIYEPDPVNTAKVLGDLDKPQEQAQQTQQQQLAQQTEDIQDRLEEIENEEMFTMGRRYS